MRANLVDAAFELLFELVELVDLVLLGRQRLLSLLDGLFQRLLVLAELADGLLLARHLGVEGLDLIVLGLLILLRLHTHTQPNLVTNAVAEGRNNILSPFRMI